VPQALATRPRHGHPVRVSFQDASPAPGPRAELSVEQGVVHLLFAYDVGLSIDLARARQQISDLTELARIRHKGHAPVYFQFDPPPLRVVQDAAPLAAGRYRSRPTVEVVLYDFGGLSVRYAIPFAGPFEDLVALSCELSRSRTFLDDARQRVEHLLTVIETSVDRARIAELDEDYTIYEVRSFSRPVEPEELSAAHAADVARLLRSELDPLSEQEVGDAISSRVSFGRGDVALVDWNAALVYDREPEDVLAVLEFANLQLLELRFLDGELDRTLDRAYEALLVPRSWLVRLPGTARAELRRVSRMQVDGAILFERVGNALKLLGDQYLARLYRAAAQRYRFGEWNAGVLRKLETIDGIYQKVHDQSSNQRMEVLEWIIIALIAFEIVLPLFAKLFG